VNISTSKNNCAFIILNHSGLDDFYAFNSVNKPSLNAANNNNSVSNNWSFHEFVCTNSHLNNAAAHWEDEDCFA
jgi:hypothetical protein